jgi:V/A-type H+-transporting ATPase subunit D
MPKFKLTKGELKRQRDSLRQYHRYLPTLQLKKQQLQFEIVRQHGLLSERRSAERAKAAEALRWAGLMTDRTIDIRPYMRPESIATSSRNIAGVDLPLFGRVEFAAATYDLFIVPLWVDAAIEHLRSIVSLREEMKVIEKGMAILRQELRTTSQRVNLFEKVKIPEAEEAIRRIKIFIGDQMTNAVGRSKIAKKKIEAGVAEGVSA